jgi:hypothetical protein
LQDLAGRLDPVDLPKLIDKILQDCRRRMEDGLCKGKKSTRKLEDRVGFAQLFDFPLWRLHLLTLEVGKAIANAGVDLDTLGPFMEDQSQQPILGAMDSVATQRDDGYSPLCSQRSDEKFLIVLLKAQGSRLSEKSASSKLEVYQLQLKTVCVPKIVDQATSKNQLFALR